MVDLTFFDKFSNDQVFNVSLLLVLLETALNHIFEKFCKFPQMLAYKLEIFSRNPGQRGWYLNLIVKRNELDLEMLV